MSVTALSRPGERTRVSAMLPTVSWNLVLLLSAVAAIGVAMLFSAAGGSWKPWAFSTAIRYGLCIVIMLALALVSLRRWFLIAYPVYAIGFVLLLAVMVVGHSALGAQRWLHVGPIGVQPSEVMKIGIVLALARFYQGLSAQDAVWSWKLVIPAGLILIPAALVAKQPDLGTALLIVFTGVAIMFVAGLTWKVLAAGIAFAVVAIPPVVMFALHGYQRDRVLTFLNPGADPGGTGYHIIQAETALGSGGLLGKGFGLGSQSHLNFLPEKHTDFIFATFAEEFGFVGCIVLLLLYAAIIGISLRIAALSHSHFGRLSAAGITATFALYILINGAMVMGMAPVVGVPMPLMSYGGTVMITVMIGFGLIQSVRVHRYEEVASGKGSLI